MLAAILIPTNITGYFQQISQITQRFKEYSLRKILQSLCNIIFVGVLVLLFYLEIATINYHIYVIGVASISVLLAAWYIFTYRAIVFGRGITLRECWTEIIELVKLGFPLLVANLCSTLLLSLDRQFVSLLFTTEEYATYAFAYSMLSLITVATSSISTVIYPLFKRLDQEKLKNNFRIISAIVFIVVFCICLIYNPLVYFINWFLPKYSESLVIFRIILPGVALSAAITVVLHTYYKVLGHSFKYFVISLIALLISASFNVVAYLIFKTRESISIASIVSLLIWYIITSFSINKECKFSIKNAIYILLMFVSFYCSTILTIPWASFLIQITSFSVITFFYVRKDYKEIKALLFGQKKKNDTTEPSTQDVSY